MPRSYIKLPACSNCGYEFKNENNFCPVCGQKNHDSNLPFKNLLGEFLESTLHLDFKVFKTLKFLLFKPGQLSLEFKSGKRASFVPPIRLYIFISFVFFFLINFLSGNQSEDVLNQSKKAKPRGALSYKNISTFELTDRTKDQVDSLMIAKKLEQTNFDKWAVYQLHKIANSSSAEFTHLLIKNISYMMFVLMPVFGVIIILFNRKHVEYYIESLIISIHFHSFVFILFTLLLLVSYYLGMEIYFILGLLILPVYAFFMFKEYFKRGIFITATKTFFVGLLYFISLIILLILTIAVSVMLI